MTVDNHSRSFWSDITKQLVQRLFWPLILVAGVFLFGTLGFLVIGHGRWSLMECAYMTSITLTTVGYGEVWSDIGHSGRVFAMVVMWTGMGVVLYAMSTVTAFIVENKLTIILRERRMQKSIASLRNHFIVCGLGDVGYNVATELHSTGREAVLLDHSPERVELARETLPRFFAMVGEATEEEVLRQAGIERAAGLLATLPDDGQNMLITVQARYINTGLKIGARCQARNLQDKFFRAGANYVINPSFIGAMRMTSEMIRPQVVSFLDRMLRGKDPNVRVEELTVEPESRLANVGLEEARISERTGLHPIALKHADSPDFIYNPLPNEVLRPNSVIIVIGNHEQIAKLRQLCAA